MASKALRDEALRHLERVLNQAEKDESSNDVVFIILEQIADIQIGLIVSTKHDGLVSEPSTLRKNALIQFLTVLSTLRIWGGQKNACRASCSLNYSPKTREVKKRPNWWRTAMTWWNCAGNSIVDTLKTCSPWPLVSGRWVKSPWNATEIRSRPSGGSRKACGEAKNICVKIRLIIGSG